jgi:hypothetical protein
MDRKHVVEVSRIIKSTTCPRKFKCCKSKLKWLPESRILLNNRLVQCLEKNRPQCALAVDSGLCVFCECPVRNWIAQTIGI